MEHLLTTCSGLNKMWNVTECIIKNHIDSGFAITYSNKMTGYFKVSKGTEFIVLLSITRWLIWKRINNIKYDATDTDIQKGISMLKEEVKIRINNLKWSTRLKIHIKNSVPKSWRFLDNYQLVFMCPILSAFTLDYEFSVAWSNDLPVGQRFPGGSILSQDWPGGIRVDCGICVYFWASPIRDIVLGFCDLWSLWWLVLWIACFLPVCWSPSQCSFN